MRLPGTAWVDGGTKSPMCFIHEDLTAGSYVLSDNPLGLSACSSLLTSGKGGWHGAEPEEESGGCWHWYNKVDLNSVLGGRQGTQRWPMLCVALSYSLPPVLLNLWWPSSTRAFEMGEASTKYQGPGVWRGPALSQGC